MKIAEHDDGAHCCLYRHAAAGLFTPISAGTGTEGDEVLARPLGFKGEVVGMPEERLAIVAIPREGCEAC
jgi:hypothetical protein